MSNDQYRKIITLPSKFVLASNNISKLCEFKEILSTYGINIIPQSKFLVPEINESFFTFIENALEKARQAAKYTVLPVLADDSGLCVRALHGAPGIYSARYAKFMSTDQRNSSNTKHLINKLRGINDRYAYYYCILILIRHLNDPEPIIAEGRWEGEIIDKPSGMNGFDYDSYFYLPSLRVTAAELDITTKNRISHRALAFKSLMSQLYNKT